MNFKKGDIEGVLIKKLTKYTDERGHSKDERIKFYNLPKRGVYPNYSL